MQLIVSRRRRVRLRRKIAGGEISALKDRIEKIKSLADDMRNGEKLSFSYIPKKGIQADKNGLVQGTIEGDDFARAFFSIWLGPNPPSEELKKGLLGTV